MRSYIIPLTLAALVAAAPGAGAQLRLDAAPGSGFAKDFFGGEILVAQPLGEFDDYIDAGIGFGAHYIRALDRSGALSLRVDGGFLIYGHETKRVPLSPTVPRIRVDVSTSNNIAGLHIGPQLMVPNGTFRPYVNAGAGFSYFFTESSVEGTDNVESFANTTNFNDFVWSWTGGGGIYIPLRRGRTPVSLDLGATYVHNGRARYLREGSIIEDGAGNIFFDPIESETNLVIYKLGVSVGAVFGRSGGEQE